uniref:Secreted protein n=1 Tax=Globodera pallida TaxID=36090 RepID=A0A183BT70_GLOPA
MLRPLLFGLGCFLLFAPGFDGQKTIPGDDSKPSNEIPDVSELKDNLGKIKGIGYNSRAVWTCHSYSGSRHSGTGCSQLQLMCQRPTMSYASEKPSVG